MLEYVVVLNTQKTTQRDEDITDKRQHRGTKTLQKKDNTEGRRHYRQKTTQRDEDITEKRQHRGTKTLQTKDNTEGRRHYRQKTTQRDEDITDMNKTTQREPEHETGLQNVGLAYL